MALKDAVDTCPECGREYPSTDDINHMTVGPVTFLCCALCALQIRNAVHGLPADEPFSGGMAAELWERARKLYPEDIKPRSLHDEQRGDEGARDARGD